MKIRNILIIFFIFISTHAFASVWGDSESTRYEIRNAGTWPILLDRKTGRTWILRPVDQKDNSGLVWQPLTVIEKPNSKIGTLKPSDTPKK